MEVASVLVSKVMRTEFASLRAEDRLDLAEQVMKLGRVRHLPVLDAEGRLVGIVSQRDLLRASLTTVLEFPADQRRTFLSSVDVSEVMTRDVQTARPETPLGVAASRMIAHKIGCLPVVREDGTAAGLITETDLLVAAYLGPRHEAVAHAQGGSP
jgi:CBS-domain-containing membrane protein